jgi:hypothetical protein
MAKPEPQPAAPPPIAAPAKAPEPPAEAVTETAAVPAPTAQRPLPKIEWKIPSPAAAAQTAPATAPSPAASPTPSATLSPTPKTAPRATQQGLPKLEPVLQPETQAVAGLARQTFAYPVHEIYRLNYCLNSGKDCGEPAAQAWCKTQGFSRAGAWEIDENIGSLFPTVEIGQNRICAQFVCDGFQVITCAN